MRTITKRLLSLVLTLAMLLSLGLTVQAVNTAVTVTLNGTALELEAPAYIDGQDRTQVPVSIGADLSAEGRGGHLCKGRGQPDFPGRVQGSWRHDYGHRRRSVR